jgi:rarD protein
LTKRNKGIFLALLCYIIWSLLTFFWKFLGKVDSLQVFSYRILSTLVTMILYFLFTGRLGKLKKELKSLFTDKKELMYMFLASAFIAVNWLTYIYGVGHNQVVAVSLGYYINPLVSVLLAVVFLHERLDRYTKISIILAGIGVLILTIRNGSLPLVSILLPFSFALYGLVKKKTNLSSDVSMFVESFLLSPFVIIYLVFFASSGPWNYTSSENIALALSGAITIIPLMLFAEALKLAPLNVVGFVQYISPTIQLAIAVFIFKEPMTRGDLQGFIFIWLSIIVFMSGQIYLSRREND